MANLLDTDFGSESEGESFNPAPAVGSDDEDLGESDNEVADRSKSNGANSSHKNINQDVEEEDGGRAGAEGSIEQTRGVGTRRAEEELEDDEDEEADANGHNQNTNGLDDDDEDEDDEDEEDAVKGRPRKRTRRDVRNQFIEFEAEVDDEDEADDDDEEAEAAGFIAETHPDDEADLPAGAETDDRGHRELDRKREREQQMDAEKQAQLLKERYGRSRTTTTDAVVVPKRLLLPSVDDPSIWGVRCKPGKEREVVFSIMKRIEERMFTKNPLPIISAFERGGTMMGYIYVEARKQADILTSFENVLNLYPRTKMVLVSIKEMPDLLRVTKSRQLQPGGYVRLKRGKYAGDLAMIDDVETNGLEVTLRIVPRLDYGLNEDANAPMIDNGVKGDAQKRKRQNGAGLVNPASRPPQRLFSETEAKKKHSKYLQSMSTFDKKNWQYLGDNYVNGLLIKDFKIQHLVTDNVVPKLEEITKLTAGAEDGTENIDLTALAASLRNNSGSDNYLPGDMVEVYEGEQSGVCGKAISVRGDIVTLSVIEGELHGQSIEVPSKGLRKRFRAGDHVKVIGGSRYVDEVGMVVRIKDDLVTILSDMTMREITVFSKDLREASDSGAAGGLGRYDIHDLVQLDPATVGCVIKVDRESLRLLDQNGSVIARMPSQISNKIEKRRHAVATDRNGSEIRHDDTVREIGGEQKQGVILHIHRSFLFCHNREQTENSGIFVVRATNVATVAAKGGRVAQAGTTGPDLSRMNPALQRNGVNGNGAMAPPKSFGRDRALGQTVSIRKGPYKGLLGIVKDTTDLEARVELHTKAKTVTVAKEILGFKDSITGNTIDFHSFSGSRGRDSGARGGFSGATQARTTDWQSGSRTPAGPGGFGGRTPAWSAGNSRTPAWSGGASSARTPVWRADGQVTAGGRTPAWNADGGRTAYGGGNQTAYGGAGGRTPAWDSGSRTSYSALANADAFGTGSKTPAYNSDSSRTPAYAPAYNSNPDPWARAHDAPTPAAATPSNGYFAPTPAASAPTPKFSGYGQDAPTPAGAPTPYSGQPETPAWGGDDDGPRYDEGTPSP
ncbi:transcription elongation factor spt5 [Xylographa opegraphella]|nr:transcription elongation factor spt5 [Xylographa opegraphella]